MSHVEKYLLRAINAITGETIKERWFYDKYTVECFAAEWHMNPATRTANIYIGKNLVYGYEGNYLKYPSHCRPS